MRLNQHPTSKPQKSTCLKHSNIFKIIVSQETSQQTSNTACSLYTSTAALHLSKTMKRKSQSPLIENEWCDQIDFSCSFFHLFLFLVSAKYARLGSTDSKQNGLEAFLYVCLCERCTFSEQRSSPLRPQYPVAPFKSSRMLLYPDPSSSNFTTPFSHAYYYIFPASSCSYTYIPNWHHHPPPI